jgi:hypothetical protein
MKIKRRCELALKKYTGRTPPEIMKNLRGIQ